MQDARSLLRFLTVVSPVILALVFVSALSATTPTVVPIAQAAPAATLVLTTSNPAPVSGTSINLTATVTVTGASSTMGTFWIYDGTSTLVPGAMPNTTSGYVLAISTLAVGSHTLTAKYVGTTNGLTVTSAAVVVQVFPPKPTITSLSPSSKAVGAAGFTMTINGTNFTSTATAKFGNTLLTGTYTSPTQLSEFVPASLIATAGTALVTVSTAGGTSAGATFTIIPPPPVISSLSPALAVVGGPQFILTINGSNFVPGATAKWGTTSLATGFVSATQLTATVPAILIMTAGAGSIAVTTTGGTSTPVSFPVNRYSLVLNPATLPGGTVGSNYSAAVNATGTVTQTTSTYNYVWTVNGASVPTNGTPYTLPGGISFTNTGGWTLSIGGKPNVAGSVALILKVTACTPSFSGCQLTTINSGPVAFSINVVNPPPVSLPPANPLSLGRATVNQNYAGFVNATGGGPNYTWTVNASPIPISGAHQPLLNGLGLYALNTGGYTLSIAGTPTGPGTVTFTAVAKDTATGVTSNAVIYSIAVNGAMHIVNGGIRAVNCGAPLSGVTVSINTNPVKTVTTNSDGAFSIFNVPDGNYTVTPSISGPSSIFYPPSQSAVVNGNDPDVNFQAALGYTVSGSVNYAGSKTGRIYVDLYNNSCGGSPSGTSIPAKGTFTIRGVPPGAYQLNAWMDPFGKGIANAADPLGNANVTVSNANVTNAAVTITDPPAATLSSPPSLQGAAPFNTGAVVFFNAITNNNGIEMASSYTLQWSTSPTFKSAIGTPLVTGSQNFLATGPNGSDIWIVNGTGLASGTGLVNGTKYYFRAMGVAGASTSLPSAIIGPITIGAPTAGNKVTGQVTFGGTATGPLYVGFYDQSSKAGVFVTQVGTKTNPPTSPASYAVYVPTGSNYFFFGIVDQNNNGVVDTGDIQNTGSDNSSSVSIAGAQSLNLTLPIANGNAAVTTNHSRQVNNGNTNDNYSLQFKVSQVIKRPVAVTLVSGPHVLVPMDAGLCVDCGRDPFNFWLSLGGVAPTKGSIYGLQVTYADGTSETLNATVSAVLNAFATLNSPTGTGVGSTPNFSWTDPASAASYLYWFSLSGQNSNGNVWQIPGNNSKSTGFPASITSLTWGVDPLQGDNSLPNQSSLPNGTYNWQIDAIDSNYNSSSMDANFTVGSGSSGLSLPSPNPSSLGPATVGQLYNGAINASGGPGGGNYSWTVNGVAIPTNNIPVNAFADGLTAQNSGGNTLFIVGTPLSPTSAPLNVTVKDTNNETASQTYSISVTNSTPLSLPAPNAGTALVGSPFSGELGATGGMSPWTWTINGVTVSPTGTPFTLSDGLTATSNGGNWLTVSGTPTSSPATVILLNVKVKDSKGATAGPVTYSINVISGPSGAHNGYLNGRYVCKFDGFNDKDGSRFTSLASFQADGLGNLSSGVFDMNSRDQATAMSGTVSGAYNIGSDNNGLLTTNAVMVLGGTGTHSSKYAIALNNLAGPVANEFRMVEIGDVGASPSGSHGAADCYQAAATTAFVSSTISGHGFVFSLQGENGSGTPKANVGRFSALNGIITNGIVDGMRVDQTADSGGSFTGSYGAVNTTTGRLTITINPTGSTTPVTLVAYIVDTKRMFLIETAGDSGLNAGEMRTQQQATYSKANLSGPFVLYSNAYEYSNGSISGYDSSVFRGTGNGAGGLTINQSYSDNNGTYKVGGENGGPFAVTFDATYPGRVTFTPPSSTDLIFLYFFNTNSALELDLNGKGYLETGWIEPQTQTTFTNAAFAGNYMLGEMPRLVANANGNVGELNPDASGNMTGAVTDASQGTFSWEQSLSMTYSWDTTATGTGSLLFGSGTKGLSCVVVGSARFVCIENASGSPHVMIMQK